MSMDDVHKAAKAANIDPVWLGCSCEECNNKFSNVMQIGISLEMIGVKDGEVIRTGVASEEYLRNPLDIAQDEMNKASASFEDTLKRELHAFDAAHIYQKDCDCKYCSDFKNNTSVFEKEIWNKAIEVVLDGCEFYEWQKDKIRKLKK